jgi:hypothetical protein
MDTTKPKTIFQPGHPRCGGRKKGSLNKRTRQAIEICEAMDFHPASLLATVIMTGKLPNPDGTTTDIDAAGRLDALKALCPYVMPKLQATQVTGKDEGPVNLQTVDIAKILADPSLAKAAVDLAMKMALAEAADQPAIEPASPELDLIDDGRGGFRARMPGEPGYRE